MARRSSSVLAGLLLIACAHEPEKVWYKPGATPDDFDRSRASCAKEAAVSAQPTDAEMKRFGACMQRDGWAQVPKPTGMPTPTR
ncbi:MAG TPA: hypothetical protein VKE73_09180 [Myxococcota bacterium]|nr:hypothetical protein [Myxococcota bacterium]